MGEKFNKWGRKILRFPIRLPHSMVLLLFSCKFPIYPFGKVVGMLSGVGGAAVVKLYYYLK